MLQFSIISKSGQARYGELTTPHGKLFTPAFVTVGTIATVKGLSSQDLELIGTQIIICNTYHLHLQPGVDTIACHGGLHHFMGWKGPLMTDSGGFQIFSHGAGKEHGVGKIASIFPEEGGRGRHLSTKKGKSLVQVMEDRVRFVSYLDGSTHEFTPELVIELQKKLGPDIILPLDECTSPLHDYHHTKKAMERTHRWAEIALEAFNRIPGPEQALFGIVQGGAYRDLRQQSAAFIGGLGFQGFAIGGSLGRSKKEMLNVLDWTLPLLPEQRPRHLLGIGEIEDIFHVVERGIDLFDCVVPTRTARTGTVFVKGEMRNRIHLLNRRFKNDLSPIEEDCPCPTCRGYSRSYMRHLFKAKEVSGIRLATIHNLFFVERLMKDIRQAIANGTLDELRSRGMGC